MNIFDRESIKRAAWRVIHSRPGQAKPTAPQPSEPEINTLGGILIIFILLGLILAVLITFFN